MSAPNVIWAEAMFNARRDTEPITVPAVGGGSTCRRGLVHRVATSQAATDLREWAWLAGLLLAALVLIGVTWS